MAIPREDVAVEIDGEKYETKFIGKTDIGRGGSLYEIDNGFRQDKDSGLNKSARKSAFIQSDWRPSIMVEEDGQVLGGEKGTHKRLKATFFYDSNDKPQLLFLEEW